MMRALVVGSGSIGRRHARNLRTLGVDEIAICDPDVDRSRELADEIDAITYTDIVSALEKEHPDLAVICTPPVMHVAQALQSVEAGADVFIEKPLSPTLDRVDELSARARKMGRAVGIGYNLRYHPGLTELRRLLLEGAIGKPLFARIEMGQYLPDWRPWQDYRQSYTAQKRLGGGIILDGSHEVDYALWLLGKPVELVCMASKLSDLEVDVEDSAEILMRFEGGSEASLHLDFVQRDYSRCCKIAGSEGTLEWSYTERAVRLYQISTVAWEEYPYEFETNDMYLAEMRAFLEKMGSGDRTALDQGAETLRVAMAALQSAEEKRWVPL